MSVPITGLYAGLLALLLLGLAANVIRLRWAFRMGAGDGGERTLIKAIRAHGNAAEYIPIALVLLLVGELGRAPPNVLHACGAAFVAARIFHALGIKRSLGPSIFRMLGVVFTFAVIATLAVIDIAAYVR